MKAKIVKYERLRNLGNYQHEKVGIEIEIEKGDKAEDALEKAKLWVKKQFQEFPSDDQVLNARQIIQEQENFDEIPF